MAHVWSCTLLCFGVMDSCIYVSGISSDMNIQARFGRNKMLLAMLSCRAKTSFRTPKLYLPESTVSSSMSYYEVAKSK